MTYPATFSAVVNISIHALVKRATCGITVPIGFYFISIHALVKRATKIHNQTVHDFEKISIHALVKRATYTAGNYVKILHISIHALVKRATYANLLKEQHVDEFQSTPS